MEEMRVEAEAGDGGPGSLEISNAASSGPSEDVGAGVGVGSSLPRKVCQTDDDHLLESDVDSDDEFSNVLIEYGPSTFFRHPYTPYDELAVEYFNGDNVSVEAKKVVETGIEGNYKWNGPVRGEESDEFPLDEFKECLNDGLKRFVRSYVNGKGNEEAQLVVIFGTLSVLILLDKLNDEQFDGKLKEKMAAIWGKVNTATEVITGFPNGLIGNVDRLGGIQKSLVLENWKLPCLSGLAIPKVSGLGTKTFVVTEKENRRIGKQVSLANSKEILGITEEIEPKLKGIVFFHLNHARYINTYEKIRVVRVIHTYLKYNRHVAMAGGLQLGLRFRGTHDETVMACGFLVFGDDDKVQVNCAALLEKGMSENNKKKLEKLKANFLTPKNKTEEVSSFALMFASLERGKRMHGEYGVETACFKQLLPKTKLVGTFDFAVFHREILDSNRKGLERAEPDRNHCFHSSAFFVVSYAHPTN